MTDYPPPPGPGYPPNPAGGSGDPQPPVPQPPVPQAPVPQAPVPQAPAPQPPVPQPPVAQYPAAPQGPYQGVPQQQQPPQYPGVPQAQYQGVPQPVYQQAAPAAPSPFAAGLAAMWKSSLDVWRGQPEQAVRRSKEVTHATGAAWAYWLPTFIVVTAVQFVLMLLLMLSAGAGSDSILSALLSALFTFGMLCLASLAIMVAHRAVGSRASYSQSATSYALGNAFWLWGSIPVTLVLMLINGFSLGVIWLQGLIAIFAVTMAFVGMTVVYLSAKEDTPQQSSILLPMVGFVSVVYGLAYLILITILYNWVVAELGGMFNPFY